MLLATFFFSFMNIGVKYIDRIPSTEIVFIRALVTLVVGYILLRRQGLDPRGTNKKVLLLRGLTGTIAMILYFYTVQHMPLASAVTIQYLSPIFTVIIAGVLLKESPRPIQWMFFVISFIGVIMVKGFDPRVSLFDLLIGIGAAVGSAFAYNFIRKLKSTDHPLVVVFYFSLVTVPIVGVYSVFNWVSPTLEEWLIMIGIGLAVTIAQIFMTKGYQLEKAANVSNFNYLGTIYALAFGYFFFDEMFGLLTFAGIGLIIFGVLMSSRFRQI
ncbi:MAG: DMT family transporter [candidate division Zixibacteria bacterium]|nr:DMT family transporter [candidate division Zixibacteria bacterium]